MDEEGETYEKVKQEKSLKEMVIYLSIFQLQLLYLLLQVNKNNDNDETTLLAFCKTLHESTNDCEYDSDEKVHENSEQMKNIEENQECPVLSALCQKCESTSFLDDKKYTIETELLIEYP